MTKPPHVLAWYFLFSQDENTQCFLPCSAQHLPLTAHSTVLSEMGPIQASIQIKPLARFYTKMGRKTFQFY